jgi:hypothetical protein
LNKVPIISIVEKQYNIAGNAQPLETQTFTSFFSEGNLSTLISFVAKLIRAIVLPNIFTDDIDYLAYLLMTSLVQKYY